MGTDYINIALPKGRLGESVYNLFARAGYGCPDMEEESRKLVFSNEEKGIRYFRVKPADVTIYVERGAADIGVAGRDIIMENTPDVYELMDLSEGKCKMCVAAEKNYREDRSATLRVATKFPNIARSFYENESRDIDIILLHGSIELAPVLGLSDVIVDIVETGRTLKENNLEVLDTIADISAELVANKASYKFKRERIEEIKDAISVKRRVEDE